LAGELDIMKTKNDAKMMKKKNWHFLTSSFVWRDWNTTTTLGTFNIKMIKLYSMMNYVSMSGAKGRSPTAFPLLQCASSENNYLNRLTDFNTTDWSVRSLTRNHSIEKGKEYDINAWFWVCVENRLHHQTILRDTIDDRTNGNTQSATGAILSDKWQVSLRIKSNRLITTVVTSHVTFTTVDTKRFINQCNRLLL
jgi:hypothetical protein